MKTQIQQLIEDEIAFQRAKYEREWSEDGMEDGLEEEFAENIVLRPGASTEDIEACEQFLGRKLSPSYKQFLSLHDGWEGCFNGSGLLLGTHDYMHDPTVGPSAIYIDIFAHFCEHSGDWFPAWPFNQGFGPELYKLSNFYRLWDAPEGSEDSLSQLRQAVAQTPKPQSTFIFHHTLIGTSEFGSVVLDHSTVRADGEMDVLWNNTYGDPPARFPNFLEFLIRMIGTG